MTACRLIGRKAEQIVNGRCTKFTYFLRSYPIQTVLNKGKFKASPATGRGGPKSCRTSRFPHFPENRLTGCGDVGLKRGLQ